MKIMDIAEQIATATRLPEVKVRQVINKTLEAIVAAAASGEEVTMAGFGKFKVLDRPARTGRNPATGKPIQIAASKSLAFSAGKKTKDALNGGGEAEGEEE